MIYLQVVKGSEILEVLYGLPDIREYLFSLYECKYEQFFLHLGELSVQKIVYLTDTVIVCGVQHSFLMQLLTFCQMCEN